MQLVGNKDRFQNGGQKHGNTNRGLHLYMEETSRNEWMVRTEAGEKHVLTNAQIVQVMDRMQRLMYAVQSQGRNPGSVLVPFHDLQPPVKDADGNVVGGHELVWEKIHVDTKPATKSSDVKVEGNVDEKSIEKPEVEEVKVPVSGGIHVSLVEADATVDSTKDMEEPAVDVPALG